MTVLFMCQDNTRYVSIERSGAKSENLQTCQCCSAHLGNVLEGEAVKIIQKGVTTAPSIKEWLKSPFPGLFITVFKATIPDQSQRVRMLKSADV